MAINPVRADSRMPNGPINLRKESIRFGFADLEKNVSKAKIRMSVGPALHLDNTAAIADV